MARWLRQERLRENEGFKTRLDNAVRKVIDDTNKLNRVIFTMCERTMFIIITRPRRSRSARPIVVKLSRGRSVGLCVGSSVRRSVCLSSALWKNGGSDPDAVWHHRSDGSRDEAVVGFRNRSTERGIFSRGNLGRVRQCRDAALFPNYFGLLLLLLMEKRISDHTDDRSQYWRNELGAGWLLIVDSSTERQDDRSTVGWMKPGTELFQLNSLHLGHLIGVSLVRR